MMGTIKVELGKIANIMKMTYIGKLKWAKIQTTKRAQIKNNKTSLIKLLKRLRRNESLYFRSDKSACVSSNSETLSNMFYKFHKENFRVFHQGRLPMRIRLPEKSLYFSIENVTHYNETL